VVDRLGVGLLSPHPPTEFQFHAVADRRRIPPVDHSLSQSARCIRNDRPSITAHSERVSRSELKRSTCARPSRKRFARPDHATTTPGKIVIAPHHTLRSSSGAFPTFIWANLTRADLPMSMDNPDDSECRSQNGGRRTAGGGRSTPQTSDGRDERWVQNRPNTLLGPTRNKAKLKNVPRARAGTNNPTSPRFSGEVLRAAPRVVMERVVTRSSGRTTTRRKFFFPVYRVRSKNVTRRPPVSTSVQEHAPKMSRREVFWRNEADAGPPRREKITGGHNINDGGKPKPKTRCVASRVFEGRSAPCLPRQKKEIAGGTARFPRTSR